MKINDEWELTRDAYNIILVKIGLAQEGKKAGQMVERERYFYPTMEKACLAMVAKSIDTTTAATILDTITRSTLHISTALKLAKEDTCEP